MAHALTTVHVSAKLQSKLPKENTGQEAERPAMATGRTDTDTTTDEKLWEGNPWQGVSYSLCGEVRNLDNIDILVRPLAVRR